MRGYVALMAVLLVAGCGRSNDREVKLEFRIVETEPAEGLAEMTFPGTGESLYLHDEILLSNADVDTARVTTLNGRPAVEVIMTEDGAKKFALLTRKNIGKRVGILVDGKLVTAPVIRSQIFRGKALINGDFTREEAERIAKGIVPR
jgi:preprotein translocase subunit SecD